MRRGRIRGTRVRRRTGPGEWAISARIERFVEPVLLLLLRGGATHGYDLLERLPDLLPEKRVDMGNLYRFLRALEEEGLVRSEWRDDEGPARRTYELTEAGGRLLDQWADALRTAQGEIDRFLARYADGKGVTEDVSRP